VEFESLSIGPWASGTTSESIEQRFARVAINPCISGRFSFNVKQPRNTAASDGKLKEGTSQEIAYGAKAVGQANVTNPFGITFDASRKDASNIEKQRILSPTRWKMDRQDLSSCVVWIEYVMEENIYRNQPKDFGDDELPQVTFNRTPRPPTLPTKVLIEVGSFWTLKRDVEHKISSQPNKLQQPKLRYRNFFHRTILELPSKLLKSDSYDAVHHVQFESQGPMTLSRDRPSSEEPSSVDVAGSRTPMPQMSLDGTLVKC
jgi:hypothetical protein